MTDVQTEPAGQPRDTLGLVAGVLFALVGLTYLIGGHAALSDHGGVLVAAALVLIGLAGVASSITWRRRRTAPESDAPQ